MEMVNSDEAFESDTDEYSIQLDNHGSKIGELRQPKAKHPIKVHVWEGIKGQHAFVCLLVL